MSEMGMRDALAGAQEAGAPPASHSAGTPSLPRVLLVDDQPARLLSYQAILSGLGVECVRAHSGADALERLMKQEFAVILLDVHMPGMDGFETARMIREHPRFERTPIIFITGIHVTELDQLKGYEVGAIDYISVPVVPEILRSKVAVLVELYQRRSELQVLNRALEDARTRLESQHASEMAQTRAQLEAIFENPSHYTVVLQAVRDESGGIVDWVYRNANRNSLELLSRTRAELMGKRTSEVLGERARVAMARCTAVATSREPTRYETQYADRDFLVTIFAMGDDSVVSSAIDITERKQAELALRLSEERFRELANNIDQFAWTCDAAGNATWYNDRWYDYTGTTFDEMRDEGWRQVIHPEHLARVVSSTQALMRVGRPWEDTFPLRRKDGVYRWFLCRCVPIHDASGRVTRWFGTNTDVTEQRRLQEALKETDRRKDEFLAMLSHELRNPVAPIRNAAEVLQRLVTDDQQRSLVTMVQRQAGQLSRLLDDLLDVARITQGRIELRREVIDLTTLIAVAVETVEPLVRDKEHEIVVTPSAEPLYVNADRVRLTQCLANVLNNAVKYTDPGGRIAIRAHAESGQAVVEIEDSGIGISAEFLPRAFDLFAQSERALDRSQGGLGIGLSICKQLLEMHGGSITGSSPGAGRGATFTIRVPLVSPPMTSTRADRRAPSSRRRVLVVDDNHDAADSLALLLQLAGYETRAVYSGREALELAASFRPETALLDIGLPEMDGYEVGRRLRETLGPIRLVAISGYGRDEDKRRTQAANFDAHLVKPVTVGALERLLSK